MAFVRFYFNEKTIQSVIQLGKPEDKDFKQSIVGSCLDEDLSKYNDEIIKVIKKLQYLVECQINKLFYTDV